MVLPSRNVALLMLILHTSVIMGSITQRKISLISGCSVYEKGHHEFNTVNCNSTIQCAMELMHMNERVDLYIFDAENRTATVLREHKTLEFEISGYNVVSLKKMEGQLYSFHFQLSSGSLNGTFAIIFTYYLPEII